MKQSIDVVVVGCGGMAKAWVANAIDAPTINLVGLVDLNRQAAEAMAEHFELDASIVFDSLSQAIETTGADAVFDVTVPKAHEAVTVEALGLGCHVLGEKPMAESLEAAKRMVAAAQKAGKVYAVTQTRRPLPAFKAMESALEKGTLGRVAEVHCDFFIGAHFDGFRAEMEHPLLVDMAIHTLDNGRALCNADPVSVYCESYNPPHSWYKGDASATAIFEMADGLMFTYRGSWCADGGNTDWAGSWRIIGEHGSMLWNEKTPPETQIVDKSSDGLVKPSMIEPIDLPKMEHTGHTYLIRQFADHLLSDGKTPLECPCEDNIKSLAMVLAAVKSAESGRREPVQW